MGGTMELILASQSPRRREIMELMGLSYQTEVCTEPEQIPDGLSIPETVMHLAEQKAAFALRLHPHACVIGADTVVDLDGEIIGKPKSPEHAGAHAYRLYRSCRFERRLCRYSLCRDKSPFSPDERSGDPLVCFDRRAA